MNKTYISVLVLILIGLTVFFVLKGKKSEAPVINDDGGAVSNTIPVLGEEGAGVNEMVVDQNSVKEFTVSGKNFAFAPSTITVNKGDKVKITFENNEGFHDFVIDEFGAATKQVNAPATEVLEFTADKTGSFEYYCSVGTHRQMGMKGTLVVQ